MEVFGEVRDPRDCTSQHLLPEILSVALAAVLCGASHCTEMELFARAGLNLPRQFIPLKHGVPSHGTFGRVLATLDIRERRGHSVIALEGNQSCRDRAVRLALDAAAADPVTRFATAEATTHGRHERRRASSSPPPGRPARPPW